MNYLVVENEPTNLMQGMGFYSWSVPRNLLFADHVYADLYGLSYEEVQNGLPVEVIFKMIAEEERPKIAKNVHQAIISGKPSGGHFSIHLSDGTKRSLVSFGRCLRDADGTPSMYTGAVVDASLQQVVLGSDPLEAHCLAALELARKSGNELATRYIESALKAVSPIH